MNVHGAVDEILGMCVEARQNGEPLPVDSRLLNALVRYGSRRAGLPHPLAKYAMGKEIPHGPEADIVMDAVNAMAFKEPWTAEYRSAMRFLFDSRFFLEVCKKIGMDGEKFRENAKRGVFLE